LNNTSINFSLNLLITDGSIYVDVLLVFVAVLVIIKCTYYIAILVTPSSFHYSIYCKTNSTI